MEELLDKSEALNSEFSRIFDYGPVDDSNRIVASWIMCSVALEHSESIRQLMRSGNYTTAISVMRLQFEAVAKATWLFYTASDNSIDKMTRMLSIDNDHTDNSLPTVAEMTKKLGRKVPKQAKAMFIEFKDVTYKHLSLYLHGGIHALQQQGSDYPEELLDKAIKSSNGLLAVTALMAATLTGNKLIAKDISKIKERHKVCLPMLLV
jgi:hypothetical protein